MKKYCLNCGKDLVKVAFKVEVFLECPDCRVIWDYYLKKEVKNDEDENDSSCTYFF